ncbi:hypothetical protein [Bifidobacterium cuniculi]|nr:hypothetical protein [Bifidobacterium cuniculi]
MDVLYSALYSPDDWQHVRTLYETGRLPSPAWYPPGDATAEHRLPPLYAA